MDEAPRKPWLWRKGQPSANPGGKARSYYKLAERIRRSTGAGQKLVRFALRVLDGKVSGVTIQHRLDAMYWLADRGWGKPSQSVEVLHGQEQPAVTIGVLQLLQQGGVAQALQLSAVEAIRQAQATPSASPPPVVNE